MVTPPPAVQRKPIVVPAEGVGMVMVTVAVQK